MGDKDIKKQVPLRISQTLWNDLAAWADDEFRSLNGQIEYLLNECVKTRKKGARRGAARSPDSGQKDEIGVDYTPI
jgi:hypothetical protein